MRGVTTIQLIIAKNSETDLTSYQVRDSNIYYTYVIGYISTYKPKKNVDSLAIVGMYVWLISVNL